MRRGVQGPSLALALSAGLPLPIALAQPAPLAAATAPAPAGEPAMLAARLAEGERLVLDGTLSHPAWSRAPGFDRFIERDPRQGAAPPQRTRVQVLYDDFALWVGVTAFETEPQRIRRPLVRRDEVNRTQDFVVVYVDGVGQRQAAQFFRVNAAGSIADGLHTAADDNEDFAPDFDWDAAVAPFDGGWTAVLRIPLRSLRFAAGATPGAEAPWRIMVARRLPREQFHLVASVPIPRGGAFIATMQPLQGMLVPEAAGHVAVRPGVTLSTRRDAGGRNDALDPSLDLKWRPRQDWVVDATLNPDFSQVELDVPQLAGNTRFALSVAEKRPFFFESADLLRSPTEALYTRSFTAPRAGLRATWRGERAAGTAIAVADRGGGLVLLPGPYGTDAAEQPGSRALALRGKAGSEAAQWGGIAVLRRYEAGAGDNAVLGPDATLQLAGDWRLRGQWLMSRTTARPDARGALRSGPAQDGHRVLLRLARDTETRETALTVDDIGGGFRHDSGFVPQSGVRKLEVYHAEGWRNLGWLNALFVNVDAWHVQDRARGRDVEQVVRPGMWLAGPRNLEAWFEWFAHAAQRPAADAAMLQQRYFSSGFGFTPAPWVPRLEASADWGRLADFEARRVRDGARVNASARLRALPRLELEPRLNLAWLDDEQGRRTYDEQALRLLAIWHLDARSNLRLIAQRSSLQRLAEPGVAAADALSRTTSLTYAWRIGTGTQLFVGATRARPGRAAPTVSEAFVKLQFDVDEARAAWARSGSRGGRTAARAMVRAD
jgi:hypothetical protein